MCVDIHNEGGLKTFTAIARLEKEAARYKDTDADVDCSILQANS
jgi:hypothetical protein